MVAVNRKDSQMLTAAKAASWDLLLSISGKDIADAIKALSIGGNITGGQAVAISCTLCGIASVYHEKVKSGEFNDA